MPETVIAGRYRLDEPLGRSGMSEVWRAEDLELGRDVAIKLLAPDADTARFEREARAVASLAHPNLMQLFDYGESDGRPYMVLEYVPGGTLEGRLRGRSPLPDDEALAIAAGIAAGLAHAHARGVVHRDLKPANVLFDEEGRPKVADFGIARMTVGEGTLTETGTVLGTAAYISPEQAVGEPASAASDVYSWGVILYRMLTGRLPFESNDPLELIRLHREAAPPPIERFRDRAPAGLESTAMAALAKNPANRPQNGAAVLAELGVTAGAGLTAATAVLSDEPTQVLPVTADASPNRSRAPLVVGVLLVLGLGGGALAYAITQSSSAPGDTGTFAPATLPTRTASTTAATTTAPSTSVTTEQTTSQPPTTEQQTAPPPTTQPTTAPATAPATTQPTTTTPPTTVPPTTDTTATTSTTP